MRTFTLASLFILCSLFSNAQFATGSKMISGNLYFNLLNTTNSATPNAVQHQLNAGVDVSTMRFKSPTSLSGVGLAFGYGNYHTTGGTPGNTKSNNYNVSAFLSRVKLEPLSAKFYLALTGTAGLNYGFGKLENTVNPDYTRSNSYGIYVAGALGIWYKLHNRLLLSCDLSNLVNVSAGHSKSESRSGAVVNTTKQTGVNFHTGLSGFGLNSLGIGVRYLLK